jgi:hypothetical protein
LDKTIYFCFWEKLWFTKIIFAGEQKCIINHSGLAFCAGMVVTNTTFALEKFFINVFPPKDFLNSLLKVSPAWISQIENGTLDYRDRHADSYTGSL